MLSTSFVRKLIKWMDNINSSSHCTSSANKKLSLIQAASWKRMVWNLSKLIDYGTEKSQKHFTNRQNCKKWEITRDGRSLIVKTAFPSGFGTSPVQSANITKRGIARVISKTCSCVLKNFILKIFKCALHHTTHTQLHTTHN